MRAEYNGENEGHVKREEMAYLLAYEEWESTLNESDRAILRAAGADVPELEHGGRNVGVTKDAADLSAAQAVYDFAASVDTLEDRLRDAFDLSEEQAVGVAKYMKCAVERAAMKLKSAAIVYLAGEILMAPNLKLFAAALAYASGLAMTNGMGSMRQWAAKNALTPAAVSKVATKLRRGLGLPAGVHLKTDKISQIFSEAQKEKHWRKKKFSKNTHYGNGNSKDGARTSGAGTNGMGLYIGHGRTRGEQ